MNIHKSQIPRYLQQRTNEVPPIAFHVPDNTCLSTELSRQLFKSRLTLAGSLEDIKCFSTCYIVSRKRLSVRRNEIRVQRTSKSVVAIRQNGIHRAFEVSLQDLFANIVRAHSISTKPL